MEYLVLYTAGVDNYLQTVRTSIKIVGVGRQSKFPNIPGWGGIIIRRKMHESHQILKMLHMAEYILDNLDIIRNTPSFYPATSVS